METRCLTVGVLLGTIMRIMKLAHDRLCTYSTADTSLQRERLLGRRCIKIKNKNMTADPQFNVADRSDVYIPIEASEAVERRENLVGPVYELTSGGYSFLPCEVPIMVDLYFMYYLSVVFHSLLLRAGAVAPACLFENNREKLV